MVAHRRLFLGHMGREAAVITVLPSQSGYATLSLRGGTSD